MVVIYVAWHACSRAYKNNCSIATDLDCKQFHANSKHEAEAKKSCNMILKTDNCSASKYSILCLGDKILGGMDHVSSVFMFSEFLYPHDPYIQVSH